jgi:uncharacterized protein (TIGR02466 family)
MEHIEVFQTKFYKFISTDNLSDKILELVKKENYKNNFSNKSSTNDLFYDKDLFDWLDDCLNQVKITIGLPSHLSLPITSCWSNKSKKLMAHHKHSHANSIISGIFYLTDHDCAPTIFYEKNYWVSSINKQFSLDNAMFANEITSKIYPKKSTLILFPSTVQHSVPAVNNQDERYTIAFNTYLSGTINKGSDKCRLDITAKSVRDHYNN